MCWISDVIAPAPPWTLAQSLNDYFAKWSVPYEEIKQISDDELRELLVLGTVTQEVGTQTPTEWEGSSEPIKAERSRAEPRNRVSDAGMIPPLTGNRTARTL